MEQVNYINFDLHICYLPSNIVQLICQFLVDSEIPAKYLGRGIVSVLSLRTTCSHFNDLIKNLPLKISLMLPSNYEFSSERDRTILKFMNEVSHHFNWRIKHFQIEYSKNDSRSNGVDLVTPFTNSCSNLFSGVQRISLVNISFSVADSILKHLQEIALNASTVVYLLFFFTIWPKQYELTEPYLDHIQSVTIRRLLKTGSKLGTYVQSFVNLTHLRLLCRMRLSLLDLVPLKFLEYLVIRCDARTDEVASLGAVLHSAKYLEMDLTEFRREQDSIKDMKFIDNHFPNLSKIRMWNSLSVTDLGIQNVQRNDVMISLPNSCKSLCLHSSSLLSKFEKISIENLCLVDGDLMENFQKSKFSHLDLKLLLMGKNYCENFHQFLDILLQLLNVQPNLQYFKLDVSEYAFDQKFKVEGDVECILDWFTDNFVFLQQHENLKAIIVGNLVLSFTHPSMWQKEWIFMSSFDDQHASYPVQIKPLNPVFIDIASKKTLNKGPFLQFVINVNIVNSSKSIIYFNAGLSSSSSFSTCYFCNFNERISKISSPIMACCQDSHMVGEFVLES